MFARAAAKNYADAKFFSFGTQTVSLRRSQQLAYKLFA